MADELGSVDEINRVVDDDNCGKIDPIGLGRATADPIGPVGDSSGKIGLGSAAAGPIGDFGGGPDEQDFGSGPSGLEAYDMVSFKFGSAADEKGKDIGSGPRLGGTDRGVLDCDLGVEGRTKASDHVKRMEVDSDLKRMEVDSDLKRMEVDSALGIEGRTAGPGGQVEQMKGIEAGGSTAELRCQVGGRKDDQVGFEVGGLNDEQIRKDIEIGPRSRTGISTKGKETMEETSKIPSKERTVEETGKPVEETMGSAQNLAKEGRQPPEDTKKGSSQNQTKAGSHLLVYLLSLLSLLTRSKWEEKRLRSVICRSLLLPVVSAIVLWFSRGDPLLVVWRFSLLLCYGCLIWTNFLIPLGRATVFMYITYGLLLASWADSMLNPAMGVLIVHLNSHFATSLLGYALAERLQRQGIERSAFDVLVPASDEEVKRLHILRFFGGLALAGPMLGVAGGMLWLVWHSSDYAADELVMDTLILLPAALLFGIVIVAMFQLRGALISADHIMFVVLYFIFVTLLRTFCKEALDNVMGLIITWITVLALSALLGYCVSVLASFKRMHIVGDNQGETKLLELMGGAQIPSWRRRVIPRTTQTKHHDLMAGILEVDSKMDLSKEGAPLVLNC